MEICKQLFRRLTTALTILLMAFVLVKSSTDMYYNYISGNTHHLTYILLGAAFVLGCTVLLLTGRALRLSEKTADRLTFAVFLLMMAVQFVLILTLFRYYLPWADSLSVMNEAISMSTQAHPTISSAGRYFEMYGNNYFFTIVLCYYFKFFRLFGLTAYWMEGLFLNMFAMDLGVWFCLATAKATFGNQKRLILAILCLLNPLLYVFLPFVYTNTISIPFTMGIFCLPLLACKTNNKKKRIAYAVWEAVLLAVGFQIRVTTLIPVIALMLWALVSLTFSRDSKHAILAPLLTFAIVFVLLFGGCKTLINTHVPEDLRSSNFPVTHWLMMGLQGDGGYSAVDEDYTYSFPTKEEKSAANREEIRLRLGALADSGASGILKFVTDKITVTWASEHDGLYLETGRMQGYSPLQKYFFGAKNDLMLYYYQFYKVLLYILALIALLGELLRRKCSTTWLYGLTMLGFFAFYILWEANCRYTICLTLILTVLGFHGINTLLCLVSSASGSTDNGLSLGTVKRLCAAFLLVCILLPCIYAMVRQYPTYTQTFVPKTDYSIITVGREYHENAVTGIAAEHKTLTQTFTTAHSFNEIGIYCAYDDTEEWSDAFLDEHIYQFRLLDADGNVLASENFGAEDSRKYYKRFGFDLVTPSGASTYTIEITARNPEPTPDRLKFLYFDFDTYDYIAHADLAVDGESLHRDLIFLVADNYSGPYTTVNRYRAECALILLYLCGISAILLLDSRRQTCYNK